MTPKELDEVKNQVQGVLDKYLKPEERFSIQDLDEDEVFLLIDLLTEKNDEEREKMREGIRQRQSNLQKKLHSTMNSIIKIKDTLNHQKDEVRNLDDLEGDVKNEELLNKQLGDL